MSSGRLWLVSPVYKDVEAYVRLHRRALEVLADPSTFQHDIRFVVVDDSAGDDEAIAELKAFTDVTLISVPFNLGHQRAIVYGLRYLEGQIAPEDYVVTLDADGEDQPEDLPRMLVPLVTRPAELRRVVVAQRTTRTESLGFKALYFGFRLLFRVLTGLVVRSGNFAAFRGWLVRGVLHHPSFDLCYSSTLIGLPLNVEFVDCARGSRYAGQSRMSLRKLIAHGITMLMPFTDRIAVRAMVLFFSAILAGMLAAVASVVVRLWWGVRLPSWTAVAIMGVLVGACIALTNLLVLFAVFSQSNGLFLHRIETIRNDRP
jgi:glycosyltransferase involved in cell wall biosynthesis